MWNFTVLGEASTQVETTFEYDDVDPTDPTALAAVNRALVEDERCNAVGDLATLLAAHGHKAIIMQGGMSTADRRANVEQLNEAKTGDGIVVIGTTPFIGEGFDAPALSALGSATGAGRHSTAGQRSAPPSGSCPRSSGV